MDRCVDIDNFKHVNDTYGHLQGDKVLKESAAILASSVRAADLLVRYGGDEFLIVLPSCAGGEHEGLVGRIAARAGEWNRQRATDDFSLSFSVGYAHLDPERPFAEAIKEADAMMYQQKLGRKKCIMD